MFPGGDGVPYYVLRELAFMRRASHPCLARLELVNLHNNHLSTFFECVLACVRACGRKTPPLVVRRGDGTGASSQTDGATTQSNDPGACMWSSGKTPVLLLLLLRRNHPMRTTMR